MALEIFPDLVYFPPVISTSTMLQSSWTRVHGWGGAYLCQAVTRQWPLRLSKRSLKNANAELFPLRCLEVLLLGQQESLWDRQVSIHLWGGWAQALLPSLWCRADSHTRVPGDQT